VRAFPAPPSHLYKGRVRERWEGGWGVRFSEFANSILEFVAGN